jgi:aspartate aminotransferase
LIKAAANLQSHSSSNPTSVSQYAALAALTGDQSCVKEMVKAFARRRILAKRICEREGIPYIDPRGAFYLFFDVSQWGLTAHEFATGLLETHKVVTVPGESFGCGTHVRISIACSDEELEQGLKLIAAYGKSVMAAA